MAVNANDYCGTITSTSTSLTVNPVSYGVAISIAGVPASVPTQLQVDGVNQAIQGSGQLSFPKGTSHTISVDEYLAGSTGIRYHCPQNMWTFNSTENHTFNYQTQYQFTVTTDPEGIFPDTSQWFSPDSIVRTNPAPQMVTIQKAGVQYVFKYWKVDGIPQTTNATSLIMNGPHTAVAKYLTRYELLVDSENNLGNPQGSNYYDDGAHSQLLNLHPRRRPNSARVCSLDGRLRGSISTRLDPNE